jgi:hypothetical protein
MINVYNYLIYNILQKRILSRFIADKQKQKENMKNFESTLIEIFCHILIPN